MIGQHQQRQQREGVGRSSGPPLASCNRSAADINGPVCLPAKSVPEPVPEEFNAVGEQRAGALPCGPAEGRTRAGRLIRGRQAQKRPKLGQPFILELRHKAR